MSGLGERGRIASSYQKNGGREETGMSMTGVVFRDNRAKLIELHGSWKQ